MSASNDEHTAHAIIQVLARLDAALTLPRRCCDACGCLCRRGENCPNCAITNAQAHTRRAS